MPKKNKTIYVDTNVLYDYIEEHESDAVLLFNTAKKKKWKLVTSTFSYLELYDLKKNDIYLWDNIKNKKSIRTILGKIRFKDMKLKPYHFKEIAEWDEKLNKKIPLLETKDLNNEDQWRLAKEISNNTCLNSSSIIS